MSRSLEGDDFELIRTNKPSFVESNLALQATENFTKTKERYETEIRDLKDTIKSSNERENKMLERIEQLESENNKLHKKIKEIEINQFKKTILSEKYKDMDDFINHMFKYIECIPDDSYPSHSPKTSDVCQNDVNFPSHFKKPTKKNNEQDKNNASGHVNSWKVGILKWVQAMITEIFQFREILEKHTKEIDYLRQKENKLMYLFFLLHKRGVEVNEVYDSKLKDVPTERFNEWVKEHIDEDEPPEISFESDASFSPIEKGPMPQPIKPEWVPKLNFETIPDYVTSSDDEEEKGKDSTILKPKNSLDGSKLHRRSEVWSDISICLNPNDAFNDGYSSHYEFGETKKEVIVNQKPDARSSLDSLCQIMPISHSLNTESINFNFDFDNN